MSSIEIPIENIIVPEDFIRSETEARKNLVQLAKSIEEVGLIHPIKVASKDDNYVLVAGFRRLLAYKQLGRETIRAEILEEPVDEIERTRISLIENMQREKLIQSEEIEAAVRLYLFYGKYTTVAEKLFIDYNRARDLVGLQDAPDELIQMVGRGRGRIGRKKAIELLKSYPDNPEKVIELAKTYSSKGLTKEEKERIFEVIKENPDRTVEEIKKEIQKPRKRFEFVTVLPVGYYQRLEKACEERDMDPPELAKFVLMEWIDENVPI